MISEEQKSDLEEATKRLEGAEARLVNVRIVSIETKKIDKMLISDIMSSKVGLIIISLEAVILLEFQKFIRYNQDRISLLVVDEAYLVPTQGKNFRLQYSQLQKLRRAYRNNTNILVYSTIVSEEARSIIYKIVSLRDQGDSIYKTQINRSSIDRPDIAYIVKPIPRDILKNLVDILYQVFRNTIDPITSLAIPEKIGKTAVFQDYRKLIDIATYIICQQYIKITENLPVGPSKYTQDRANRSVNVYDIITFYTSYVVEYNKKLRYNDFKKIRSVSRILNYILAAAIGTNIPDIKFAIQLGQIVDKLVAASVASIQQKFSQAGRLPSKQSYAILLLLYYVFDTEKTLSTRSSYLSIVLRVKAGEVPTSNITVPIYRDTNIPVRPSRLRQTQSANKLFKGNVYDDDEFDLDPDLDKEELETDRQLYALVISNHFTNLVALVD